jgi:hypothetical protein
MATKKISELPLVNRVSGSQVAGGSVLPIVIGGGIQGTTNQISVEDFSLFVNAYNATTSSNTFIGTQNVTGDVNISGRLTVREVVAQYETASILFSTGSTKLGDQLTDKHEFTGSTNITGSISVNGNSLLNGVSLNNSFDRLNQATQSLELFTSSQADRNLVLSIVTGSINQATASIQFQTASLLQFTASQDNRNFTLSQVTGSFNYFYQATASLQSFTASQADRNLVLSTVTGSINQATASLQTFTASQADRNLVLSIVTGSINQATASIQFQTASLLQFTASQDSRNFTLSQVTGSFREEIGGLEAYTASLKNSTIVSSSTQIFTGYDYEIHVSQVDGNDTTGNGDLLTPVATITKALQIVSSSYLSTDRRTIIIHPGTYTESPTVTLTNTYIFALGLLGANTAIAGTLTINAACRVSGIKMTNLIVNTTGAVYINNTTVDTQMTVTNTGYLETTGCSFQCPSGVTVSGAAPAVVFNSTTLWGLVVNNASAVVIVRNSPQVYVATVTAGNLALSNTLLFSSTPTGNAITTSANSIVTLSNLNILIPSGLNVARVSLSGFYSIIDVVYDKPNSTLVALSGTGGSLNSIDYFQYINADKFITQGGTDYQFLKGDGSLDSKMPSSLQQTTASLNTYTGSNDSVVARILQTTASLNTFTASQDNRNLTLSTVTGSLIGITNGLMAFTAALDNTYATDAQLYQLYQSTASLQFQTASLLQFTASEDSRNFTLSQVTGSFRGEIGGLEAYTASLKGQAIVSSSTQVQNYDVFALNSNLFTATGSLIGITNGLMALTASMKGQAIVSSSQQIIDYNTFAVTSSANTFYGNQTISGSLRVSAPIRTNIISGGLDVNGGISGSFRGNIDGVAAYATTIVVSNAGTTTDTSLFPTFTLSPVLASYTSLYSHASSSFFFNGVTRRVHMEGFVVSGSNNIAEISGSLNVSGSVNITGSLTIDSVLAIVPRNTTPAIGTVPTGSIIVSASVGRPKPWMWDGWDWNPFY